MRSPEPLRRRAGRAVPAHLLPKAKEAVPARLPVIFGVVEQPDRLLVRFRDATCAGGVQEIDLSNWLVRRDIGLAVARTMESWGLDVVLMERDKERALYCSGELRRTMVLNADALAASALDDAGVVPRTAFIGVTGDDDEV